MSKCTDFEICGEYNIREIESRIPLIEMEIGRFNKLNSPKAIEHKSLFLKELNYYKRILQQSKIALENQEILTIARKMNKVLR